MTSNDIFMPFIYCWLYPYGRGMLVVLQRVTICNHSGEENNNLWRRKKTSDEEKINFLKQN